MTKIGLIGTGSISRVHMDAWARLPVDFVGVYDVLPEAAQRAAAQYGVKAFSSLSELLANVDMVDICTPATAHKEPILAAAQAGKGIICEKPLARQLADCREILQACRKAGAPLYVAQVVRFFPEFAQAKRLIEEGSIGRPGVIRTVRTGSFPRPGNTYSSSYYGDFARSGRVILDVGIHDIDFQRWCCGEVERVFARGTTFSDDPRNDHALIVLRFAGGAMGHIECSWAHTPREFRTRLEIAGDAGLVEWDSLEKPALRSFLRSDDDTATIRRSSNPLAPEDTPYHAELAHFLHCFETGSEPRITGHDAYMAVKVALAAVESVRTGRPITIADFAAEEEAPA